MAMKAIIVLLITLSNLCFAGETPDVPEAAEPEDVVLTVLGKAMSRRDLSLDREPFAATLAHMEENIPPERREQWLGCKRLSGLMSAVQSSISQQCIKDNGLAPTDKEIKDYISNGAPSLAELKPHWAEWPVESEEPSEEELDWARYMVVRWRMDNFVYDQYGGRIVKTEIGPMPRDAHIAFYRASESNGAFHIHDAELRARFWACSTNVTLSYYSQDEGVAALREHPAVRAKRSFMSLYDQIMTNDIPTRKSRGTGDR